jgi:hypothetical protein
LENNPEGAQGLDFLLLDMMNAFKENNKQTNQNKKSLTSRLKGQKTVGFCSFAANFSQLFYCLLTRR